MTQTERPDVVADGKFLQGYPSVLVPMLLLCTCLVIQEHGAGRGMAAQIIRDDALHPRLLRRREDRTLRIQHHGMDGGHQDVRAIKQLDELSVRGGGQVRADENLHAAILEVDDSGLRRGAHDGCDALRKRMSISTATGGCEK